MTMCKASPAKVAAKPASSRAIKRMACDYAAQIVGFRTEEDPMPLLWQTAAFFEAFLMGGAEGSKRQFGPKPPVKLRSVPRQAKQGS